ncbi:guanitoxin biosynthesis heme-dependent pre-guanitoxin N-hydroxylase GntA [Terrabacter sp. BE26]|uniref:guanitoxin biosynthesis heme-dependent pre-guanitoxin N-hydroxylase GntA n=1 Tax=Terrabacter sp. BE26 TaxID=2898152 RepID=UPI0035BE5F5D
MSTDTSINARTPAEATLLPAVEEHPGLESTLDLLAGMDLASAPERDVVRALELMVTHAEFPCLGAKSVFRRGGLAHVVLDDMDDPDVAADLLQRLRGFADDIEGEKGFHSFIATFRGPVPATEAGFEAALFQLLQRLHDVDEESWADGVGADPNDPHFAFSAGGTAYFIVGLHPAASRVARRAPLPTLVFNPHAQFEELRAEGRFEQMRSTIRRRDIDLQGFVNPMVADHGDSTEALQYSGRRVPDGWQPPLEVHVEPGDDGATTLTAATTRIGGRTRRTLSDSTTTNATGCPFGHGVTDQSGDDG